MKKTILLSLAATSIFAFAYTQTDVSNANYLADNNIITKQSDSVRYRLSDNITRAEVVAIALKIKGVKDPASYKCKKYFSDTVQNDWVCRAVEVAADNWIVSRNNKFRPQDKITRAEALALLMRAGNLSIPSGATVTVSPISDKDIGDWWDMVFYAGLIKIIDNPNVDKLQKDIKPFYFYPNRSATRTEVFGFAKNILEYKQSINTNNFFSIKDGKLYKNNQILLGTIDWKSLVDYEKFCNTVLEWTWVHPFSSLIKIHDVDKQFLAASIYEWACGWGLNASMIIIDTEQLQYKKLYEYINKNYPNNQLQLTDLSNGKVFFNVFWGDGIFDLNDVASNFNQDKKSYEEDNIYFQKSISIPIENFFKN